MVGGFKEQEKRMATVETEVKWRSSSWLNVLRSFKFMTYWKWNFIFRWGIVERCCLGLRSVSTKVLWSVTETHLKPHVSRYLLLCCYPSCLFFCLPISVSHLFSLLLCVFFPLYQRFCPPKVTLHYLCFSGSIASSRNPNPQEAKRQQPSGHSGYGAEKKLTYIDQWSGHVIMLLFYLTGNRIRVV